MNNLAHTDTVFSASTEVETSLLHRPLAFAARSLPILLAIATVAFGGVHETLLLPLQAILFIFGAILLADTFFFPGPAKPIFQQTVLLLNICVAYLILHYMVLSICDAPHPVLATHSCNPAPTEGFHTLLFFASCIVLLFVTRQLLTRVPFFLRYSLLALWGIMLSVTLIALSHWFYDSGKLFWRFSPDYVFPSSRARWPFVNSNHLGHFLILSFFLLTGILRVSAHHFQEQLFRTPRFSEQPLFRILPRPRYLYPLLRICFQSVLLIAVLLSLAATLSRSSWIGFLVAAMVLTLLTIIQKDSLPVAPVPPPGLRKASRRKKREGEPHEFLRFRRRFSLLFVAGTLALFCFFLFSGRGVEMVEGRVEFGLAASKEDIRWTLYSDSLALLKSYPLLGAGISSWNTLYPEVMSTELAAVNPEFLHSDPFQFLIEAGVAGIFPLLLLFLLLSKRVFFTPPPGYAGVLSHSLYAGMVGFLAAACFDFPFRIPAISYLFVFELALLLFLLEPDSEDNPPKEQLVF